MWCMFSSRKNMDFNKVKELVDIAMEGGQEEKMASVEEDAIIAPVS